MDTSCVCPSVLWPFSQDTLSSLKLRVFLLLLQHLGAELWILLLGLHLFPPSVLGLHPRDEAEQHSSNNGGNSCQVEGHIVAAQSVPEETCNQKLSGRNWLHKSLHQVNTKWRQRAVNTKGDCVHRRIHPVSSPDSRSALSN